MLDASVVINMLALETGFAREVLRTIGGEFVVPQRVLDKEVLYDPRDRAVPARPRFLQVADGLIDVRAMVAGSLERFVELAAHIGDGEAATIAHAEQMQAVAVLDDHGARRHCAEVKTEWSVDLLSHPRVVASHGETAVARCVLAALQLGRMRVPQEHSRSVIDLIGLEAARACPSLSRKAIADYENR